MYLCGKIDANNDKMRKLIILALAVAMLVACAQTENVPEKAVREFCEKLRADGLGLMFLEGGGDERNLTPLVYVPGGGTTFWENSCASGSAAVGMYLAARHGAPAELTLHEPGGALRVSCDPANGEIRLRGGVSFVGEFEFP